MASSDGTGHWWQRAIIYQVYPRSFQDSDGDGIGDLEGIRHRLDHLERLGIDTIWLSPIYPSPMADFGYDVADYGDIDGRFGTMADFDRLIADVHRRGMKLVLDFVPNHSSDHHPWFVQSRSSRESPKRDWYIWRDPKPDGSPPNNWMSHFGGSTWTFDAATGQYYLHSFLKEQPDLNWRNPQVKQAIFDVLRFWLGKGVDGFRVDVIWCLVKDEHFRDNPVNPDWKPGLGDRERLISIYECDRPEMMGLVAEMRAVLDTYPGDRLLIGEIYLPLDRLVAYYGVDLKGAQLPFNFLLIGATWSADSIGRIVADYNAALPAGAWPNWVLSNHDRSRIASRVGPAQARVAAMLLLTLRGTPTIYYGEEIGMLDTPIPPELVQDPSEKRQPGIGLGRDPVRTPMPWDASPTGGFTTGHPWLPLGEHATTNVAAESRDPHSMLSLYEKLIALRHAQPALIGGTIEAIAWGDGVVSYERRLGAARLKIVLNLTREPRHAVGDGGRVLLSTTLSREGEHVSERLDLGADEGVVVALGS
ncbi:putative alpha-glucosidase [Beijerinckiaceae bacterium RH CH11]|nr:alpha-amylase family glycosyl hydrolase [Beijerinckiaceae bacterium]VVB47729.1 putative alpha-glucosidase [Beijerinckiaceae bacterium RH CH11]VVB47809.1 putative alpha-glucosidase [Beijerinckiaceae bacterium RH AL8]